MLLVPLFFLLALLLAAFRVLGDAPPLTLVLPLFLGDRLSIGVVAHDAVAFGHELLLDCLLASRAELLV